MKSINVEPNWEVMFQNAAIQVKAVVAKDDMRDFIVEMLEFGGRLYETFMKPEPLEESIGEINKRIRKGMEGMERKAEVE